MDSGGSKLLSDASSLVDLKAEVFRKQNEAKSRAKTRTAAESTAPLATPASTIWKRKQNTDEKRPKVEANDEEIRVRDALERKARFYDKLKDGKVASEDRFLVQFNAEDDSDEDSDEEVEFTDALGRTRTCSRKELRKMKKKDKELQETLDVAPSEPDLLSEDMRREMLRQKWEREEEENLKKRDVHYNDVLFDEARSHGAGFYKFSKDEAQRAKERDELDELHRQTTEARSKAEAAKKKRQNALKARLKKVRDNKRLRMGLPIKEDDDETSEEEKAEEEPKQKSIDEVVMEGLREMREKQAEEKRKATVREWDVGKSDLDIVLKGEKKVMSQQEWVTKKRQERPSEFAPGYQAISNRPRPSPTSTQNRPPSTWTKSKNAQPGEFAPCYEKTPTLLDVSRPPPSLKRSHHRTECGPMPQPGPSSAPALDPMASLCEEATSKRVSAPKQSKVSLTDRLKMFREFGNDDKLIHNNDREEEEEHNERNRGAEIAPPCDMDYYGHTKPKKAPLLGFRSHEQIVESFNVGLNASKNSPSSDEDSDDD